MHQTHTQVQVFILGEVELLYAGERIELWVRINADISWDQRDSCWTAPCATSRPWNHSIFIHVAGSGSSIQAESRFSHVTQRLHAVHQEAVAQPQRRMRVDIHCSFTRQVPPHVQRQARQLRFTAGVTRLKLHAKQTSATFQFLFYCSNNFPFSALTTLAGKGIEHPLETLGEMVRFAQLWVNWDDFAVLSYAFPWAKQSVKNCSESITINEAIGKYMKGPFL